jgi:hypothetical protein
MACFLFLLWPVSCSCYGQRLPPSDVDQLRRLPSAVQVAMALAAAEDAAAALVRELSTMLDVEHFVRPHALSTRVRSCACHTLKTPCCLV